MAGPTADLASRLNARRRWLGISTSEMARAMDMSRSNVNSLMSGKRSPTPAVAEKLIETLRLDGELADELRSLDRSDYRSGFAQGPVKLTED